ncbi:HAD hydrolase-like protein [Candidatus Woesearchaeota archaeon]|nr:HAD hydrolase-like protein [Candidatus Woesearchaeota archaeon]
MIKGIIFDWIGTLHERDKGLYPDAMRVVKELKKRYTLGLVTLSGKDKEQRTFEISTSGVMKHLECILIVKEKTPEEYLECMAEMRTTPETTAIVDDRTIRGIKVGNKLGCQTYWIKRGDYAHETPTEETGQPTEIITCVGDLLEFF